MHGGGFSIGSLKPGDKVIDKGLTGFGSSKLIFVDSYSEIDPMFNKYVFKYKFNDEHGNPVILTNYQAASRLTPAPATTGGKLRSRQQKRGRTQRGRTQRRRSPRQQKRRSPRQQKRGRTQRGRRSPRE